ncbi:MAG: hypothetical protein KC910_12110 [Candidatus Eremiobacteraeota bacterium]|nr:hypothetical protein [Candidatus Eremiobacteraeota bacterium]
MDCPFCEQRLGDISSGKCNHCGQDLAPPPTHVYGEPAKAIVDALAQVRGRQMPMDQLPRLFSHLMGSVQQVLDQASEDLSENFGHIQAAVDEMPADNRLEISDFMEDFREIQDEINDTLLNMGDIFDENQTLDEFRQREVLLNGYLMTLQSSVDALGALKQETSISALQELPNDPLPADVEKALDFFDKAMGALVRYIEDGRDLAEISACLRHTEAAKTHLARLLLVDSMRGS